MDSHHVIVALAVVFALAVNFCPKSDPSSSSSGRSSTKSVLGNASEERVQGSQELKEEILRGLTREERALRNYEDEMILKGETKSNSHYGELQRKAEESRR
jgi:hypothetical protein